MGCFPKIRVPRRLLRLFKKKKDNRGRDDVELGHISHPFDVYRIDSKGNRVALPQHLPVPVDLYGQVVPHTDASAAAATPVVGTGLTYRGIPVPDGSAVTDGSASDDSVAVDPKAKTGAHAKKDAGGAVAGPAPKDI
ncbi:hypothetical protein FVEN_g12386 [Fusarium venenatum]|uniref:Uncharacterized protein n=1 Tax=Fusarium venenatum TaxID=56646 RepID=A0A2L2TJ73_9HYPO|nr:uncharacterized protein FVRRES_00979 [Fusarium venenatum]KAG8349418.1 hypothetical protein FVEN_g12386 [Fusarium venenatum]KAH7005817.1 hypothetical protein EDB82DRAFT_472511 [Fusarium venenatum]CEI64467.1 unnamed protein product [Fusarium venenatum]